MNARLLSNTKIEPPRSQSSQKLIFEPTTPQVAIRAVTIRAAATEYELQRTQKTNVSHQEALGQPYVQLSSFKLHTFKRECLIWMLKRTDYTNALMYWRNASF